MKYSVQNYAQALAEALANPKTDKNAAAKNFLALVRRNGDEARLKKILDEAGRLTRGKDGIREITIESARPLKESQKKAFHAFAKAHDIVREKINPDLIAGVKMIVNDEMQFDGSMKAKLDAMFSASAGANQ